MTRVLTGKLVLLAVGATFVLLGTSVVAQTAPSSATTQTAPSPAGAQSTTPPAYPPQEPVMILRPLPVEPPPPPNPNMSFSFSIGYAKLDSHGGDSKLDGADGWYIDSDFEFRLKPDSPLWAGFSINGSYFWEEDDHHGGSGTIPAETEVDASLSNFCLEPRLTLVLLPKRDRGVYLAGRVGAGLLIADYWATAFVDRPFGTFIESEGDVTAAFEVRPGVQVGYCGGSWAVGADVSEMWAWGDFNRLGDEMNELRIGFFVTFRY